MNGKGIVARMRDATDRAADWLYYNHDLSRGLLVAFSVNAALVIFVAWAIVKAGT